STGAIFSDEPTPPWWWDSAVSAHPAFVAFVDLTSGGIPADSLAKGLRVHAKTGGTSGSGAAGAVLKAWAGGRWEDLGQVSAPVDAPQTLEVNVTDPAFLTRLELDPTGRMALSLSPLGPNGASGSEISLDDI